MALLSFFRVLQQTSALMVVLLGMKSTKKEPITVPKTDAMTSPAEWFVLNIMVAGENE
jgi:hypothetical protein